MDYALRLLRSSLPCARLYSTDNIGCVIQHLQLIRENIPEKLGLTEDKVRQTLSAAPSRGAVVAVHLRTVQPMGIVVWYESEKSLYLWLGAVAPEYRRARLCSYALHYLYREQHIHLYHDYGRWFTKVGRDNMPARRCLETFGFQSYGTEADGRVVLMELCLPQIHWWLR